MMVAHLPLRLVDASEQLNLEGVLLACDVTLEATRAAVTLAKQRTTTTRLYRLGSRYVLELGERRTIVLDPSTQHLAIFKNVQEAVDYYAPTPLMLASVSPA